MYNNNIIIKNEYNIMYSTQYSATALIIFLWRPESDLNFF